MQALTGPLAFLWAFMLKRVSRWLTGRGELERLLWEDGFNVDRHAGSVAQCIERSRALRRAPASAGLQMLGVIAVDPTATSATIEKLKGFGDYASRSSVNSPVHDHLLLALQRLNVNAALLASARRLEHTPYDAANAVHEAVLLSIWAGLSPDTPLLARRSTQWERLGFQGLDPASDFRGAGELGLRAMAHIAEHHTALAASIIARTDLPYRGFPLALVVLALCEFSLELLRDRRLLRYVEDDGVEHGANYGDSLAGGGLVGVTDSSATAAVSLRPLYDVIAALLRRFDVAWWASSPTSIMDYRRIFTAYREGVASALATSGRLPELPVGRGDEEDGWLRSAGGGKAGGGEDPVASPTSFATANPMLARRGR